MDPNGIDKGSVDNSSVDKRAAEWLLARLSSPERASEIVGDLLEQRCSRSAFLWPVLRVVLALTWLRALGFVVAAFSILCVLRAYYLIVVPHLIKALQSRLPRTESHDQRLIAITSSLWDKTAAIALLLSLGMWVTAVLTVTWLPTSRLRSITAFSLSLLLTAISWSAAVPYATPALLVVLGCVVGILLAAQEWRWSFVVAAAGAIVCVAVLVTATWSVAKLEVQFMRYFGHSDSFGLVRGGMFTAAFLLTPALCGIAITLLHGRLTRSEERVFTTY